jgi:hypothetical protein
LSDFGMAMFDLEQSDPAARPTDNPQEYILGHTSLKYPPVSRIALGVGLFSVCHADCIRSNNLCEAPHLI